MVSLTKTLAYIDFFLFGYCSLKIHVYQNKALPGFRRHEDDLEEKLKADFNNVYDQEEGVIEMVGAYLRHLQL